MARTKAPAIATPENLDPALTQIIVVDFGEWGRGETLEEALSKIPPKGRRKLESYMQVWHIVPGTYIGDDGIFYNNDPALQIRPVLNETRRTK
uniref:Uncharacterized protein n=1 Tax=Pseudomonas phage HRDY3 TaxID=3236930 RepID=A0AB39CEM9_9VIRU